MVLPLDGPHPPGVTNPITFRARAALPAASAWDAAPLEIPIALAKSVTLFIEYIRAAAGGAADIQIFGSPYSADQALPVQSWFSQALYAAGALAAGADVASRVQREYTTYQATGAAAETFIYGPIDLQYIERLRIRARESGAVANPGTCHIVGTFME